MFGSQPSVVGWSVGMALIGVFISVGVTLAIVFLVGKAKVVNRISDVEDKLRSTVYDVNVQNAANKEGDDKTAWYVKNVLLTRINTIESVLKINHAS